MSNINISLIEKLIEKTKHHSLKWVKLSESNMQLKPLAENPFGLMKQAIGDDGIYHVNNENSYISSYANGTFALLLYDAVLFESYVCLRVQTADSPNSKVYLSTNVTENVNEVAQLKRLYNLINDTYTSLDIDTFIDDFINGI